ncbi:hypothetical protein SDC9_181317 [bioreactor metagenome]|uniref:Uncharacterized protein n=1 Tax=bioreactor metagenome TaxID=1076179 RepID=A0A645H480_9ZZZZ
MRVGDTGDRLVRNRLYDSRIYRKKTVDVLQRKRRYRRRDGGMAGDPENRKDGSGFSLSARPGTGRQKCRGGGQPAAVSVGVPGVRIHRGQRLRIARGEGGILYADFRLHGQRRRAGDGGESRSRPRACPAWHGTPEPGGGAIARPAADFPVGRK